MTKHTLFLLLVSFILSVSCGEKTDEELLQQDLNTLNEYITGDKVQAYKLGKIMFRSSAADSSVLVNYLGLKQDLQQFFSDSVAQKVADRAQLDPQELLALYKDIKRVQNMAATTDEDDFPTLTDCYSIMYEGSKEGKQLLKGDEKLQTQNVEHALLSAVILASREMGQEFALYESSKIEADELPESEIKALILMARALIYFEKELLYLSIHNTTQNIDWLEANDAIEYPLSNQLFKWNRNNNTQSHQALLGMNYAFRGITRLKTEHEIDQERAFKDFEQFIACAHKAGLDNELVWIAEVYVYFNNKEYDKAIAPLKKLEQSSLLSEEEKRTIAAVIDYLEHREEGATMTALYDKAFVARIASQFVIAELSQVDWQHELEKQNVPYTKEAFTTLHQFLGFLDELNSYSIKGGLKKAGEETKETGKSLWNKAKELAD